MGTALSSGGQEGTEPSQPRLADHFKDGFMLISVKTESTAGA